MEFHYERETRENLGPVGKIAPKLASWNNKTEHGQIFGSDFPHLKQGWRGKQRKCVDWDSFFCISSSICIALCIHSHRITWLWTAEKPNRKVSFSRSKQVTPSFPTLGSRFPTTSKFSRLSLVSFDLFLDIFSGREGKILRIGYFAPFDVIFCPNIVVRTYPPFRFQRFLVLRLAYATFRLMFTPFPYYQMCGFNRNSDTVCFPG